MNEQPTFVMWVSSSETAEEASFPYGGLLLFPADKIMSFSDIMPFQGELHLWVGTVYRLIQDSDPDVEFNGAIGYIFQIHLDPVIPGFGSEGLDCGSDNIYVQVRSLIHQKTSFPSSLFRNHQVFLLCPRDTSSTVYLLSGKRFSSIPDQ